MGKSAKRRKVRVLYFGLIRNVVGRREEEVYLPPDTSARELLRLLAERHGEGFAQSLLARNGELRPSVTLLLDGQDISSMDGLETRLKGEVEASIVATVQALAGGSV